MFCIHMLMVFLRVTERSEKMLQEDFHVITINMEVIPESGTSLLFIWYQRHFCGHVICKPYKMMES